MLGLLQDVLQRQKEAQAGGLDSASVDVRNRPENSEALSKCFAMGIDKWRSLVESCLQRHTAQGSRSGARSEG